MVVGEKSIIRYKRKALWHACVISNVLIAGGYFNQFGTWMCLPDFEIWLLLYLILSHLPPISIPILHKKHTILLKFDTLYHHLLKIHPIYVNWAPLSVMKTPDHCTKIHEKHPKRQAYICIPCHCEYPQGFNKLEHLKFCKY